MYTTTNFRSKKQLKEAVAIYAAWSALSAEQRAITASSEVPAPTPVRYFQPGPFGGNEPQNGTFSCEGPHYPEPHKWDAECIAKDGVIVKVK